MHPVCTLEPSYRLDQRLLRAARLHAIASDRRNDPELGKMGTDGVDHRGLLADEQMARAMEHQAALLLGRLGLCRVLENEMSGAYFSAEFAWQVKRNPV